MRYYSKIFVLIQKFTLKIVILSFQFFINFSELVYKKIDSIDIRFLLKNFLKFGYALLTLYLTLFAVGIARYELSLVTLNSKISNLIVLAEGKNPKFALERIAELQSTRLPIEPRIDSPMSILKSLHYKYDDTNYGAYMDLYAVVESNKNNLNNLNLQGLILLSAVSPIGREYNFSGIKIENSKFNRAKLQMVNFKYTEFTNVDFWGAQLWGADFAFAIFRNSDLMDVNFIGSNLCGAQFIDTGYVNANFTNANLVGVDLSKMFIPSGKFKTELKFQGAAYNSEYYNFRSLNNVSTGKYHSSCTLTYLFPPTKFPDGFNPEEYGMIDISKL